MLSKYPKEDTSLTSRYKNMISENNKIPTSQVEVMKKKIVQQDEVIESLKQSEQKYRHFFEKSPTMICVIDRRGFFVNINEAGAKMLGFETSAQVIGKQVDNFFTVNQGDLLSYRKLLEKLGSINEIDAKMTSLNGTIRQVQFSAALRKTVTGKVKGYEGFVIDLTSRKEAERRLTESEIRYKTVLDNSLAAIYMFQDGGYFSYVNPRMVSLLGYDSADEILGKPFWEIIASADQEMVKARGLERENKEIKPRRYKYRMLKKNGEEMWVDMRASHASYLGRPAAVGNFIDITREVKAEEQIRNLTRQLMDRVEDERRSLANDIHDEFGQLLTSLQFDIESLDASLPRELTRVRELSAVIAEHVQHLAEKVRDTTSRLRPDLLDHLGLEPTLRWYIDDIANRWPMLSFTLQVVGLKKRLPPDVELVLYRVFQEGLNNIIKHAQASQVTLQLTCSYPDIIFIIRDNGCGFSITDNESIDHIQPKQGIGLLSMQERVASLRGTMTIRSEPGKGTVLRIMIPMGEELGNGSH